MPIEAIKPRGFTIPERSVLIAELDRLGKAVTAETKAYPAWRPWKNPPPRTGPRAGGRRTGALGKSWEYKTQQSGQLVIVRIQSSGVEYAQYVQGRRQPRFMEARGWKTVQANFRRLYPDTQKRLRAWARLRRA